MAMEKAGGTPGKSSTVFVGNIPYDVTEEDVRALLAQGGKVESFRMVFDKDTRQPKGYGFCDFSDPEMAMNAIKTLSDQECNGRKLRLDLADNVMRGQPGRPPSRAPPPSASTIGSGASMLALPAPEGPPRPVPRSTGPAPIKTSGMTTQASGPVTPGQVDPAAAAAAAAADPGATPEAIMASVTAHTAIAQTVAAMPQAQLQLCLGTMQELAKAAPEQARAALLQNPQLCYALLHAQFLLGLSLDPGLPPDVPETQELRAEAVQRAMANSKAAVGRGRQVPTMGAASMVSMPFGPGNPVMPGMTVQRPMMPGPVGHVAGGGLLAITGAPARPPTPPPVPVLMDVS